MTRALVLLCLTFALAARADEPTPADPDLGPGKVLTFAVPHRFSREGARQRVKQLIGYWSERFGVESRWTGDRAVLTGSVLGVDFKARLEVSDTKVGGETSDPGLLLRSSARDYIRRKLRKYLHPEYQES